MPTGARVPPGADLSDQERARYARHILLPEVGLEGQRRLAAARVLVVGAGGLGSVALTYLAAAGVGTLGVVDDDVVETSNLQRQVVHGTSDVGRAKTASAAERVADLNPHVTVVEHPVRLDADTALDVLADYDVVVDGADNFPTRYLVGDACALLGLPHVWGSIYRFDGQASVWFAGEGPCYRCVFPQPPPPGAVPSCAEGGVLGALCSAVGSVQATEAVKLVLGIGEPLVGRLLVHDALRMTWDTVPVRPNPECPLCGREPTIRTLSDVAAACAAHPTGSPALDTALDTATDAAADVPVVTAVELAARLAARDRGEDAFELVDVRGDGERAVVAIPGARPVAAEALRAGLPGLDPEVPVILHCKSGARSLQAARTLRSAGRTDVSHLEGGVLAWVRDVDPSLPVY